MTEALGRIYAIAVPGSTHENVPVRTLAMPLVAFYTVARRRVIFMVNSYSCAESRGNFLLCAQPLMATCAMCRDFSSFRIADNYLEGEMPSQTQIIARENTALVVRCDYSAAGRAIIFLVKAAPPNHATTFLLNRRRWTAISTLTAFSATFPGWRKNVRKKDQWEMLQVRESTLIGFYYSAPVAPLFFWSTVAYPAGDNIFLAGRMPIGRNSLVCTALSATFHPDREITSEKILGKTTSIRNHEITTPVWPRSALLSPSCRRPENP